MYYSYCAKSFRLGNHDSLESVPMALPLDEAVARAYSDGVNAGRATGDRFVRKLDFRLPLHRRLLCAYIGSCQERLVLSMYVIALPSVRHLSPPPCFTTT